MTDAQASSVVAGVAFVLAAIIATVAAGQAALNVVLAISVLALIWDRVAVHERVDATDDVSDLALGKAEAIENHLTGLEPDGTGRHASRAANATRSRWAA